MSDAGYAPPPPEPPPPPPPPDDAHHAYVEHHHLAIGPDQAMVVLPAQPRQVRLPEDDQED